MLRDSLRGLVALQVGGSNHQKACRLIGLRCDPHRLVINSCRCRYRENSKCGQCKGSGFQCGVHFSLPRPKVRRCIFDAEWPQKVQWRYEKNAKPLQGRKYIQETSAHRMRGNQDLSENARQRQPSIPVNGRASAVRIYLQRWAGIFGPRRPTINNREHRLRGQGKGTADCKYHANCALAGGPRQMESRSG